MANYKGLDCIMGEIALMASETKGGIHEQHTVQNDGIFLIVKP